LREKMDNTEEKVEGAKEEVKEVTAEEVTAEEVTAEEVTEKVKNEKIEADKEKARELIENFKSDFKKNIFKPFKSVTSLITNLCLVGIMTYMKINGIKNWTWLGVLAPMWLWVVYTILSLIIVGAVFGTIAVATKSDSKDKFKPKHMFLVLIALTVAFMVAYNRILFKISYADMKAIEFTIIASIIINIVTSMVGKYFKIKRAIKEDIEQEQN